MDGYLGKPVEVELLYKILLDYLPHNPNMQASTLNSEEIISLPSFVSIDTVVGLHYCGESKKLYLSILKNFCEKYRDVDLDLLEKSDIKSFVHTIKGLSLTIGAKSLHSLAVALEKKYSKVLVMKFHDTLSKVIVEVQDYFMEEAPLEKSVESLTDGYKKKLFLRIRMFASRRRLRQCTELLEELVQGELSAHEHALVLALQNLSENRDYKAMMELLDARFDDTDH